MELWIRNQPKTRLVKVNDLRVGEKIDINKKSTFLITDEEFTLGEYATKGRCIEILDEIQFMLGHGGIGKKSWNLYAKLAVKASDITNIKGYVMVYEMPKE